MTSPPAHLLPLALEAMHSADADACAVLLDGLLESGWCTRENAIKAHATWFSGWPKMYGFRQDWDHEYWFVSIRWMQDRSGPLRAIAAVLLFGSWSEERWPLVEAQEARRRACITPIYLVDRDELARIYTPAATSGPFLVGIDRAEPSEHESTSIHVIASPHAEGAVYLLNRGALADVWTQELDGAMRRYARDVSYAMMARMYAPSTPIQHPDDEEDDDADLG